MATRKEIEAERRKMGIQPLSKTIASFKKIDFVGKNKTFFSKIKSDDARLNRRIAKSIDKRRSK